MTALAADKNVQTKMMGLKSYPVATGVTIYKGALVNINSSGYAVPASDSASDLGCAGIADEQVVNAGANGAKSIRVVYDRLALLVASSITQAMVGTMMYVVDDATVDDAAGPTNDVPVGHLVEFVSTTSGWVRIRGFEPVSA